MTDTAPQAPALAGRMAAIEGRGQAVEWIQARARGRKGLVRMEISEPNFPTPPHIVEAAMEALGGGLTGYSDFQGMLELREAVADKLQQETGIRYDPQAEVLITTGTAESNHIAPQATLDPGDEVIITDPTYLGFETCILLAGARPIRVPLRESRRWALDVDALRAAVTPRTKALMLNCPCNPCGTVFSRAELEEIARLAIERNLWVLYDMLFDKMVYDVAFENIAALPGMKERTLLLSGWSKVYAMCGFRVGWLAGPAQVVSRLTSSLHLYTGLCASPASQKAAIAALRGPMDWWAEWLGAYRRRRDMVVTGLNGIPGVSCQVPQGGFWAFPDMSAIEKDSYALATKLLEAGVVTCPGADYGPSGEGHLRIVYGHASEGDVREGLRRIAQALAS